MRITRLSIRNFRCFGPDTTHIDLSNQTAFIGSNGSGKTAILLALARMFGVPHSIRNIEVSDFHLPPGHKIDDEAQRSFCIESRIEWPEDMSGNNTPHFYDRMTINGPGEKPYCRIRLEAVWTKTSVALGDINAKISWICSPEDDPPRESFRSLNALDRDRIQVFYISSTRLATQQLANTSGTLLNQLLRSIKWDDAFKEEIRSQANSVRNAFAGLPAIEAINAHTTNYWQNLHDESVFAHPQLSFLGSDFHSILRNAKLVFNPTHADSDLPIDRLSEGQQSLFQFAFINMLFKVRQQVYDAYHKPDVTLDIGQEEEANVVQPIEELVNHISFEDLSPAPLTIFAIEEPENHLAPHCLGRLMNQILELSGRDGGQVLLTSHSPSIIGRIDPREIRYCRKNQSTYLSTVRSLRLPDGAGNEYKFVKEAVSVYPELYFSKLVILVEGDSEEYLLKKFAKSAGNPLDIDFINVVPLGGRFVSHLWRLLTDLQIPYLTLLDLDREREHGGWSRVAYVLDELLKLKSINEVNSLLQEEGGTFASLTDELLVQIRSGELSVDELESWVQRLGNANIFFSSPLDIDFLLLMSYPDRYITAYERTPHGFCASTQSFSETRIEQAIKVVLGKNDDRGITYSHNQKNLFPWYSYLFLGKGKVMTHVLAWMNEDQIIVENLPQPLNQIFGKIQQLIHQPSEYSS